MVSGMFLCWSDTKMANVFGKSGKRFSIDDAFEEESESVATINVYGSTTERSPLKPKSEHKTFSNEAVIDVDQNAPLENYNGNVTKHNEDVSVCKCNNHLYIFV